MVVLGFVGWNQALLGMKGIVGVLLQPIPAVTNVLLDLESATVACIRVQSEGWDEGVSISQRSGFSLRVLGH